MTKGSTVEVFRAPATFAEGRERYRQLADEIARLNATLSLDKGQEKTLDERRRRQRLVSMKVEFEAAAGQLRRWLHDHHDEDPAGLLRNAHWALQQLAARYSVTPKERVVIDAIHTHLVSIDNARTNHPARLSPLVDMGELFDLELDTSGRDR
jgi:hypothetical protein